LHLKIALCDVSPLTTCPRDTDTCDKKYIPRFCVSIKHRPARGKYDPEKIRVVSLGCNVKGACQPFPDCDDVESNILGAKHRYLRLTPKICAAELHSFRGFVRMLLRRFFKPLDAHDPNFEWPNYIEHLRDAGYSTRQIEDYDRAHEELETGDYSRLYELKGHTKPEFYPEYKHNRMINARNMKFRALLGPVAHAMEAYIYDFEIRGHKVFIKHVPVSERARYIIQNTSPGSAVYETDHSAFEAHMAPQVMECCEVALYRYLLKNHPRRSFVMEHIVKALVGINKSVHNGFVTRCRGRRMSGDMVTSLGNGFTNMCVLAYTLYRCGYNYDDCDFFVEGDDGVTQVSVPLASGGRRLPHEGDFKNLGFEVKMAKRSSFAESTFCTIVADEQVGEVLIDPAEALVKFGWTFSNDKLNPKLHKQLLHAKALSLLCEAPACPIVRALADYGIRVTRGVAPRFDRLERWWTSQLELTDGHIAYCLSKSVDARSRYVVEHEFGVPIALQLHVERYLAGLESLRALDDPIILSMMKPVWFHYYDNHSMRF